MSSLEGVLHVPLFSGLAEPMNKYVPPQLTVRRSFIARNIGEIPLDIRILEIYPPQNSIWYLAFGGSFSQGDSCEGYGFRILNCHPFTLQPNHTHSIDIAFTPDFTMSKVVRSLRLVDSTGGEFNYSLVAMVPSKMLSICSSVISRPTWEPLLKIFLLIGVFVALIAAGLMAYVEAGSIVSNTVVATVRTEQAKNETKEHTSKLDLKAVYDKVENRFKRNQKESARSVSSNNVSSSSTGNGSGGKNSVVANSVLSNSNSALRNRRTKKGGLDYTNNLTVSSKLFDKNGQKSSSPPVEDVTVTSGSPSSNSGIGFSKKDKENSPSSGTGSSGSGKKKKSPGAQQNAQNNNQNTSHLPGGKKKGGSIQNVCLVTGNKNSKEQEDTSSTTTESSNSDDFYIPPSSEKKGTGKNQNSQDSSSATSQNKSAKKDKSDKKKNDANKGNDGLGLDATFLKADEKKNKRKEQTTTDTSKADGKISPRHDMSLWDSPQYPVGDGLSEMAAQTEAFILHRPNKKSSSTEHLVGNGVAGGTDRNPRNSNSPQFSQVLQLTNNFQAQQFHSNSNPNARHRRPGIIGQSRYNPTVSTGLSPTQPLFQNGHHSGVQTARQHTPPSRTLSNPNAIPNNVNNWGADILPDNGCDIWSRKNSLKSGLAQTFSSVAGTPSSNAHSDMPMYSTTGNMMPTYASIFDGFPPSSSPALTNRNAEDGGYFSLGSGGNQPNIAGVPTSGSAYGNGSGNPTRNASNDRSQVFNLGMELFNNLLPMNSAGYDPSTSFRSPVYSSAGRSQVSQAPSGSSATMQNHSASHNYLQRMRSEPPNRDDARAFPAAAKNWSDLGYFDVDSIGLMGSSNNSSRLLSRPSESPAGMDSTKTENNGNVTWPSVGSTATSSAALTSGTSGTSDSLSNDRTGLFPDWGPLSSAPANSVQNVSEIWEPNIGSTIPNEAKWPTSFDNSGTSTNSYSETAAVGSVTRSGLGNLGFRQRTADNVPQSHREVEAGLGFNPFTSDIWNQNHTESNWNASTSSYHYNNHD
ncbi:Transmembrane protein [Orchesella cincta]|uniref:Transmembrane protein n=1 Tax=Orchesella cincta TaxID=48709 RepID=A0A1D2N4C0_ORCCI|nr:Transmembrane protein [Orchesella cincta]